MPILGPTVQAGTRIASTLRLLASDGTELLSVGPFTPVILTKLDFGFPDVRNSVTPIAGANGTNDSTRFVGARAITAEMVLPQGATSEEWLDLIAGLMNPGLRLWLYAQRPHWAAERRIQVRGGSFACPPGTVRTAQAGWQAPSGLLEDVAASQVTLIPTATSGGGVDIPLAVPMVIGGGFAPGAALVNVDGNAPTPPIIDIYGPCSDPLIRCVDTGQQVSFPGLSIASGDFLRVDLGARTVMLNNTQSRYDRLEVSSSSWWSLPTGNGVQVVFSASAVSAPCQAVMQWRSRWF